MPSPSSQSGADTVNVSSPFKLGKRIAIGGMAEVFLAVQQGAGGFEKLVVVKRMLPHLLEDGHFVQMFLDEARLAAKLRHPNIVSVLDIHRDEEAFTVAMEYLRGEDLRRLVRAQRDGSFRIPLPITLHVVGKLAEALQYAHTAKDGRGRPLNLVHRDVAPSNVIVTYDGQVKLIDFGVAKASAHSTYTKPGTIKGKYPYSSPEQIRGNPLDHRSDVFSLGILMHEMLTGQRLFKGDSPASTLRCVLTETIQAPSAHNPEVTAEIDAIVMGALQRDVDLRTPSADEVRKQIGIVLSNMMAKVTTKDLAQWMTATFALSLENRLTLEKQAIAAARNQGELRDSHSVPPPIISTVRTPSHAPSSPGSHAGSRPSLHTPEGRASAAYYQRLSIVEPPKNEWKTPLIVLVVVLAMVALVLAAFAAGRAATGTDSQAIPASEVPR